MALAEQINTQKIIYVRQKKELAELFGFETRNKYSIQTEAGQELGLVLEQQKGMLGFLFRQTLGHWRTFDLHFCTPDGVEEFTAHHPFRFFFQKLELSKDNQLIGSVERRWTIFHKYFDVTDASGKEIFTVRSPIWRIWTFSIRKNGEEVAIIRKKWGGGLTEIFTDADTFQLDFSIRPLASNEKLLLVAASIYADLLFFENKGGNRPGIESIVRGLGI